MVEGVSLERTASAIDDHFCPKGAAREGRRRACPEARQVLGQRRSGGKVRGRKAMGAKPKFKDEAEKEKAKTKRSARAATSWARSPAVSEPSRWVAKAALGRPSSSTRVFKYWMSVPAPREWERTRSISKGANVQEV